jgi:hypothetical protein
MNFASERPSTSARVGSSRSGLVGVRHAASPERGEKQPARKERDPDGDVSERFAHLAAFFKRRRPREPLAPQRLP